MGLISVLAAAGTSPDPVTETERIAFWESAARRLQWDEPWHTAHSFQRPQRLSGTEVPEAEAEYTVPSIEWFAGGRLNAAVNCVDRHVAAGHGSRVALHFEGEPGDRRSVTYAELLQQVCRAANALQALGVGAGDRVVIYLPVLVETIVITLACARIGAVHSLVFGGFSAEALKFRVRDTGAKLLVTTDGQYRRGRAVPVKDNADAAVADADSVEHVLVIRRTGSPVRWVHGRDVWWHESVDTASDVHEAGTFDAESPLFIMYTSGTTGRPKGLVHTTGGYLTQAAQSYDYLFSHPDPAQRSADVHWCTADLAWVTAHTYEIYGPLANGATQVIFEGTPDTPHPGRHLEIIERYGVTSYYTAPTLVRSLMGWFPDGVPPRYDLSSIRLLGTVGEAVNPEAWRWFREQFGRSEVPMLDTWWQSETGAAILTPRPTDRTFKPGCASRPMPGVGTRVVDGDGSPVPPNTQGLIVVDRPGPGMARTVWGDPQRYLDSYWRQYARQGWFLAGDGARSDPDGDTWILGRVDDVLNVSGHRLSTIEIESALVSHPWVVEAGVCPVTDSRTGHAVVAFVVLTETAEAARAGAVLRAHVTGEIGPIARPAAVVVVPDVPKTRSGKILRRLLAELFEGAPLGDTSSLQNEPCIAPIRAICAARREGTA
ncbi:acetate--CoA ligase [Arthrobacter sp. zg-Y1110]|uniref:acetate--CoA ligase n=1 Tax=Arthrobacter sp. zg-Y1110 TaxID=2886932 RepID=UPI001D154DCD|nr:acetate--CoA ligase [Arthrobacter sp. zg-Y1110]MCC3289376.1 acetate--CoA ligase [Arthrobacter sp. zg-Y1110]UWX85176.1 acetate--CoA ligase [Arthrobacter sp. zg-Y1110]